MQNAVELRILPYRNPERDSRKQPQASCSPARIVTGVKQGKID
jgi:hypothetical protein